MKDFNNLILERDPPVGAAPLLRMPRRGGFLFTLQSLGDETRSRSGAVTMQIESCDGVTLAPALPEPSRRTMGKVLVIEDDRRTAAEIAAALGDHGFDVACAYNGREGLLKATAEKYDALVLDRMLPGDLDGLGVLATLRAVGVDTPVLILSALSAVDERIRGLRAGGDDYLTKPFEFDELTARLEVLLRRSAAPAPETKLQIGDMQIDLLTRQVRRGGSVIELLPREYRLLEYLVRHAGHLVTRTMLFEEVWGYHYDPQTNVIDVHVGKLRRKLEEDGRSQMIHTVRGSGYVLRAAE